MYDEQKERDIFAQRLNYQLDLHNVSQVELAEAVGVSQASVSWWCKGTKMPRMGKIQAIADYLGIKKSDLVNLPMPTDVEIKQDELFEKRKVLFSRSNKATKEDLDKILQIIDMVLGDDKNED